jgi:nucleoside 2-deoxyribosyltransferase
MKTSRATGCVFVSHSGQDDELVRDIARRLRDAGLKPCVDFETVSAAAARRKVLRERLREADAVLILLTPTTLRSSWTMTELGMAEALDRLILPVIAGLKQRDLPAPLQSYHAVPFDQLDEAISELSERLAAASDA